MKFARLFAVALALLLCFTYCSPAQAGCGLLRGIAYGVAHVATAPFRGVAARRQARHGNAGCGQATYVGNGRALSCDPSGCK